MPHARRPAADNRRPYAFAVDETRGGPRRQPPLHQAVVLDPAGHGPVLFSRTGEEPEVRRTGGQHRMQPDVVPVKGNQAEQGVQAGDQAEDHQHGVGYGHHLGVQAGTGKGPVGDEAGDAEGDVHEIVQEVHGEQAEQVAVAAGNALLGCPFHRRHQSRDETGDADQQEHDPVDQGEVTDVHDMCPSIHQNSSGGKLEDMMAYVNEFGEITSSPPSNTKTPGN